MHDIYIFSSRALCISLLKGGGENIIFKNDIQEKCKQIYNNFFIELFWSILIIMITGLSWSVESCKDTFDFGVEMALIFFVYEELSSQSIPEQVSRHTTLLLSGPY